MLNHKLLCYFIGIFVFSSLSEAQDFLSISKEELCKAEPHLSTCRSSLQKILISSFSKKKELDFNKNLKLQPKPHSNTKTENLELTSRSIDSGGLTHQRLKELADEEEAGGSISSTKDVDDINPFDDITTRSPQHQSEKKKRTHFHSLNEYYSYKRQQYYEEQNRRKQSSLYTVYPGLHPKDQRFCSDLRGNFAFTCQPSKPLRVDLVEFCKDYSTFCQVPNVHQLPGPRLGAPPDSKGIGHVGVSGKFGFGVGAVPGMEVGVGWGVDVGPIPGMGESVGVDLGLDLGIMGASQPEQYRRGMGTGKNGNGIVGVSGGVGVKAPGSGPIGVGSGIGVG